MYFDDNQSLLFPCLDCFSYVENRILHDCSKPRTNFKTYRSFYKINAIYSHLPFQNTEFIFCSRFYINLIKIIKLTFMQLIILE